MADLNANCAGKCLSWWRKLEKQPALLHTPHLTPHESSSLLCHVCLPLHEGRALGPLHGAPPVRPTMIEPPGDDNNRSLAVGWGPLQG